MQQNGTMVAASLAAASDSAAQLGEDIVNLDTFIWQNTVGLRKITKKFDKNFGVNITSVVLSQLAKQESFCSISLGGVLVTLSDVYSAIRSASATKLAEDGKWDPPTDFSRATTKYWVAAEDLMQLKVQTLKHLPILIMGRQGPKKPQLHQEASVYDGSDSSIISSVYFDNANLDVYHTRMQRDEGANLWRIRYARQQLVA